MKPSSDIGQADWIVPRLHPFGTDVGSVVPDGFESYVRILHPAGSAAGKVRWSELATTAHTVGSTTRFEALRGLAVDDTPLQPPNPGTLDIDELRAVVRILAGHTRTPRSCWFCMWDGYGWLQGGTAVGMLTAQERRPRPGARLRQWLSPRPVTAPAGPRVQLPHRPLVLFHGTVEEADAFFDPPVSQSPNLWWPDDRSWCVASEIDLASTYVGGARELTDRIVRDGHVEAVPTTVTDPLSG